MGRLRFTSGLQLAALVVTLVFGESQTVAANAIEEMQAIEFDGNIMRVGRRDLWLGGTIISQPS